MYELNRSKVTFLGIDYEVVQVLENDLLLVVKSEDLQKGDFPIQTYVIADPIYYSR